MGSREAKEEILNFEFWMGRERCAAEWLLLFHPSDWLGPAAHGRERRPYCRRAEATPM